MPVEDRTNIGEATIDVDLENGATKDFSNLSPPISKLAENKLTVIENFKEFTLLDRHRETTESK